MSFICEHSAEFALVPQFSRILSAYAHRVVPLYFWKSREGNTLSAMCDDGRSLRAVALYARRPKIHAPDQSSITVKINSEIIRSSAYYHSMGIPVFCGVPCVSNILDFHADAQIAWFHLSAKHEEGDGYDDVEFAVSTDAKIMGACPSPFVCGPLDDKTILRITRTAARETSWTDIITTIREVPPITYAYGGAPSYYHRWWGTYKPVFLLLA